MTLKGYAAVLKFGLSDEEQSLASSEGYLFIGTEDEMNFIFRELVVCLIPVSDRSTLPVKYIRENHEEYFKSFSNWLDTVDLYPELRHQSAAKVLKLYGMKSFDD